MSPEQDRFLERLYCDTHRRLLIYASRLLHDSDQAEDAVQSTFFEAIEHVDELMRHPNPVGWLVLTLKHKVQEDNRRRQRYLLRFLSLEDLAVEPAASEDGLERIEAETAEDMVAAVKDSLTDDEWRLVCRCVIDRASSQTVADELGIRASAVRKRLERIRAKLRKSFPEYP